MRTRGGATCAVMGNVAVGRTLRATLQGRRVRRFALDEAWRRGCYPALVQAGSRARRA